MQSDRQARIRERAYQIWLEEGRAEGRQDEHWQRAEREISEEEKNGGKTAARPRRSRAPVTSEAQPAEISKSRAKAKPAAEPAAPRARAARSEPAAKAGAAKTVSRGRRPTAADKPAS